ncbi:hypothetical protein AB0M02_18545 [Actinoplanes sp. NPDC051861]|uniref:WXG100 family type VII secretion target n=1 Tax=Actinoplanes sp. NPDC051861 TaxID=3155170 RepID=UPI003448DC08
MTVAEDVARISSGIHDNSWVDATLSGVGGSLDALAVVVDPLGSLSAWGTGWLIEHVQPLRDALDWLAGDPAEITTHAATWQNVSASIVDSHRRLAAAVRSQTAAWEGAAASAYRNHAAAQLSALEAVGTATRAVSYAVEGAGLLVSLSASWFAT